MQIRYSGVHTNWEVVRIWAAYTWHLRIDEGPQKTWGLLGFKDLSQKGGPGKNEEEIIRQKPEGSGVKNFRVLGGGKEYFTAWEAVERSCIVRNEKCPLGLAIRKLWKFFFWCYYSQGAVREMIAVHGRMDTREGCRDNIDRWNQVVQIKGGASILETENGSLRGG